MDKIILSKRVAVALEDALKLFNQEDLIIFHCDRKSKWSYDREALNELSIKDLTMALYVGYEVEETPEENLLNEFKYNEHRYMTSGSGIYLIRNEVIVSTLEALGIKIEGINA